MTLIGVVGAGVVGERVLRMLHGVADLAVVDRRPEVVDRCARETGATALDGIDELRSCQTVVLTHPAPHAELSATLVRSGVNVVSATGDGGDVGELVALTDQARMGGVSLVPGAAMSPGLSGLIVRWLSTSLTAVDEVHVAMHGTAGPACAREHHRALGTTATGWHDHRWIEVPGGSGRELCWFPEPVGAYDCYRAGVVDPILLHGLFPDASRISARVSANRRDRLTAWLPMLRPPHPEGGVGALRVEVRGAGESGQRLTAVGGIAEFAGTAAAATAATFAEHASSGSLPAGVVLPGDAALPTTELLSHIAAHGVRLQSFTGVPTPG